jgi:hypothetical protein
MKHLALLALSCCLFAADAPRLFYSKEFPGSSPAYVSITLERDGSSVYKEAVNDELPVRFKLEPEEANAIFELAEKLGRFNHPLESGLKVANMGKKTFRYEHGEIKNEVTFNYSQDEDARLLNDWFERISESEQQLIRLERTVKYDKLGVNQELLNFEMSQDRHRLIAIEQFLPLLDRVAKNESYLHMARERAARLADAIRARKNVKTE